MIRENEFDRKLLEQVMPEGTPHPEASERYNLVVVGAGTAGLVAAAGAAGLGARVALIERAAMGGDCLNTGCVPSKSLLKSAHAVGDMKRAAKLGIHIEGEIRVDFAAVMNRMRRIRAEIAKNDSVTRFRDELGVDVFLGEGRFVDKQQVEVGDQELSFSRAVIATGARARESLSGSDAMACSHVRERLFSRKVHACYHVSPRGTETRVERCPGICRAGGQNPILGRNSEITIFV